jgi:hypothetical protein
LKRLILVLLLAALCAITLCSCSSGNTPNTDESKSLPLVDIYPESPQQASQAEAQGRLYQAGKINVVVLEGTYEEMGRQYGALLEEVLNRNYEGIVEGLEQIPDLELEDLQEQGDSVYEKYPKKYQEIIDGLAETSGLGLAKAKLLNMQEIYISAALQVWAAGNMPQQGNCSGMAAWGPYTSEGPLVFGRNYDLGFYNSEYVTLTVYNPIDGSLPTANLTFAGCIYVTSGINSSGLFLELNNGSSSDPSDFTDTRPWAPINLFSFLEQTESLSQLDYFFESTLPDLAYIINAADPESACSYEWSTSGVKRRGPDEDGLLVATNFFFDPSWGQLPHGEDPDYSVQRRDNLLALGEKYKGQFDPQVMMEVISLPLEQGGAFRAPNLTSYEIVAEPGSLKVWVRVPEYQDWVEIDLAEYFAM